MGRRRKQWLGVSVDIMRVSNCTMSVKKRYLERSCLLLVFCFLHEEVGVAKVADAIRQEARRSGGGRGWLVSVLFGYCICACTSVARYF